jgi:hypothetical protein
MYKEMLVNPVNKVVDPKREIGEQWSAEEEERHKGSPPQFYKLCSLNQKQMTALVVVEHHDIC